MPFRLSTTSKIQKNSAKKKFCFDFFCLISHFSSKTVVRFAFIVVTLEYA